MLHAANVAIMHLRNQMRMNRLIQAVLFADKSSVRGPYLNGARYICNIGISCLHS